MHVIPKSGILMGAKKQKVTNYTWSNLEDNDRERKTNLLCYGKEFIKYASDKRHGGRVYREYIKLRENTITDRCQQWTKDLKRYARREAVGVAMSSQIATNGH